MAATNQVGPNAERKFPPQAEPNLSVKEKLEIGKYNVLNKYRSYSYVITMAALDKDRASDPASYRSSDKLDNVILKSSGKAINKEMEDFLPLSGNTPDWVKDELKYFNTESAGRYDLYINNLEIETYPVPTPITGTSLVASMRFEVYEPYSVVGFIEALTAGARASGYFNYLDAVFLLKIEFWGYPDSDSITEPEKIPESTRYFPFRFKSVDVNFDQSGTVYRCEAFPAESPAFSNTEGATKTALQLNGVTVKEILKDLVDKVNKLTKEEAVTVKKDIKDNEIDTYNIEFPSMEEGKVNFEKDNAIADKPLKKLFVDTAIYAFESVEDGLKQTAYQQTGTTSDQRTFVFYSPDKFAVNYAPGTSIQSIIDGVVRDSEYWRQQIDPNTAVLSTDNSDQVNFWRITASLKDKNYNPVRKRLAYDITYRVTIDKIHKSRVPGYKGIVFSGNNINIVREYNYLYTGQNVDIMSLKINLDRLFYENFPLAMGTNDRVPAQFANNPGSTPDMRINATGGTEVQQAPAVPTTAVADAQTKPDAGALAGPPNTDSVAYVARESFSQIIASQYSMIKLDMEILGDPVYVMTGGMGNYIPEPGVDSMITADGEANFFAENVFLKIFFRNPTDIDDRSLDEGGTGLVKFTSRYDFSGYYMLVKAISNFRNGMFTQRLECNRMQVALSDSDYKSPEVDTTKLFATDPKPQDKVRVDSGENKVVPANQRSSLKNLLSGVNRLADSIANAEERITNAVQGTVEGVAGAAANIVAAPVQFVGQVTNRIQGALQGINNTVVDAADKLRLTPNQLASLSPQELLATVALSKLFPDNVNASQVEEKGIVVDKETIPSLPAFNTTVDLSNIVDQAQLQKDIESQYQNSLKLLEKG